MQTSQEPANASRDKGVDNGGATCQITAVCRVDGGLDVGYAAAKAHPGLPVVYTTGRDFTDGLNTLFVEPHKFIAKPYTNEHLLTAVADLLNNKKGA